MLDRKIHQTNKKQITKKKHIKSAVILRRFDKADAICYTVILEQESTTLVVVVGKVWPGAGQG